MRCETIVDGGYVLKRARHRRVGYDIEFKLM